VRRLRFPIRVRNPVLDRELRQRSRSVRSTVMLFVFLLFLSGVLWASHRTVTSNPGFDPIELLTVQAGRTVFEWVLLVELTILLFIIPAISSGAISGERDRQTLMPLQVTLVRPRGIFFGKVLASSGFVLLLVMASVPVLTVPYLLGGITLDDVIWSLLCLLAIGLMLAVVGVACSAVFRRTQTATLAAYGMMLMLTAGSGMAAAFSDAIDDSRGFDHAAPLLETLYPNPYIALAIASGDLASVSDDSPIGALRRTLVEASTGNQLFLADNGRLFDARTGEVSDAASVDGFLDLPLWLCSFGTLALLAVLFALAGVRALRAPSAELRT